MPIHEHRRRVRSWGGGYFHLDPEGHVRVRPSRSQEDGARLSEIVATLRARGLRAPMVLRFPQLLEDRLARLQVAFHEAFAEFDYPQPYRGVYPLKVNQRRVVVETLCRAARRHRYGLEVGSKAELALALAQPLAPGALLLCNGFKDRDYLELALRAHEHLETVTIIAETVSEVREILELGRAAGITPRIGLRARLNARGVGRWQESGGARSKFGLGIGEILQVLQLLEEADQLEAFRLLHFHIGSQIGEIRAVKEAVREAARLYTHLKQRAPALDHLDVGGGLAVDYDGTASGTDWSRNYDLEEYARDCVFHVKEVCDQAGVEAPVLVSESGRAVTAFHAVLAISAVKVVGDPLPVPEPRQDDAPQVQQMRALLEDLSPQNHRELTNDARTFLEEVQQAFNLGVATLEDRAAGEALFQAIAQRALEHAGPTRAGAPLPDEELMALERAVSRQVVCNFSVFQSAPDAWTLDQIFPVVPLSWPAGAPTVPASLADITCDSEGCIDRFGGDQGVVREVIELPRAEDGSVPMLGVFLVGAYQDVLGANHNLLGPVTEVSLQLGEDGEVEVLGSRRGTRVSEAAALHGFDREELVSRFEETQGESEDPQMQRYLDVYLRVLNSSCYLR